MGALNCSPAGFAIPAEGDLSPVRTECFASSSNEAGATQRGASTEWSARQRGLESALLKAEAAPVPAMSAADAAECARRRAEAQTAWDPAPACIIPLASAAAFLSTCDVIGAGAVARAWNLHAPLYVHSLAFPPVLAPHAELPATPEPEWRRRKRHAADGARRGGGATRQILRAADLKSYAAHDVRDLVRRLPRLTTLDFGVPATAYYPPVTGGDGVDSATVIYCARWCPSLTRLSAAGCLELGDDAIAAVIVHCPLLEHVSLSRCRRLTSRSVTLLAVRCGARLQSLDVSRCRKVDDDAVLALAAHCPLLETLSIACCVGISTAAIVFVAKVRARVVSSRKPYSRTVPADNDISYDYSFSLCLTCSPYHLNGLRFWRAGLHPAA